MHTAPHSGRRFFLHLLKKTKSFFEAFFVQTLQLEYCLFLMGFFHLCLIIFSLIITYIFEQFIHQ